RHDAEHGLRFLGCGERGERDVRQQAFVFACEVLEIQVLDATQDARYIEVRRRVRTQDPALVDEQIRLLGALPNEELAIPFASEESVDRDGLGGVCAARRQGDLRLRPGGAEQGEFAQLVGSS